MKGFMVAAGVLRGKPRAERPDSPRPVGLGREQHGSGSVRRDNLQGLRLQSRQAVGAGVSGEDNLPGLGGNDVLRGSSTLTDQEGNGVDGLREIEGE